MNLERVKGLQNGPRGDAVILVHDNHQLSLTRGLHEVQQRLQSPGAGPTED